MLNPELPAFIFLVAGKPFFAITTKNTKLTGKLQ